MSDRLDLEAWLIQPEDLRQSYNDEHERLPYIPITLGEFVANQHLHITTIEKPIIPFAVFSRLDQGVLYGEGTSMRLSGDGLAIAAFILTNPKQELGSAEFTDVLLRRLESRNPDPKAISTRAASARTKLDAFLGVEKLYDPANKKYRFHSLDTKVLTALPAEPKKPPLQPSEKTVAPVPAKKIPAPRTMYSDERAPAPTVVVERLSRTAREDRSRQLGYELMQRSNSRALEVESRTVILNKAQIVMPTIVHADLLSTLVDEKHHITPRSRLMREISFEGDEDAVQALLAEVSLQTEPFGYCVVQVGNSIMLQPRSS